jgi:hypothetical protein
MPVRRGASRIQAPPKFEAKATFFLWRVIFGNGS